MLACLTQCGAAKTFAATFTDHFSDNYLATGAKCEVWQRRLKDHLGAPPGRVAWTMGGSRELRRIRSNDSAAASEWIARMPGPSFRCS